MYRLSEQTSFINQTLSLFISISLYLSSTVLYLDCQCTLPDGMKMCKNLPAQMELDFIRLYQVTVFLHHTQLLLLAVCSNAFLILHFMSSRMCFDCRTLHLSTCLSVPLSNCTFMYLHTYRM